MHLRPLLLTAGSLLLSRLGMAQPMPAETVLQEFTDQRIHHQKTLGFTLGGYALANIAIGSIAAGQTTGETKYFHRMNVYWNLVNLGIAGAGLLGSRKKQPANETVGDAVRKHESMKRILLFNTGLDVAYVIGGAYLRERAETRPDQADQLRGYGKSIMMQGGFLLAFDLVNYIIFKKRGDKQERLLLSSGPSGVGLVWSVR